MRGPPAFITKILRWRINQSFQLCYPYKRAASQNSFGVVGRLNQAFPLTGFYKLILEHPQIPSAHHAYYPNESEQGHDDSIVEPVDAAALVNELAQQGDIHERARVVFGSRLTGPHRREEISRKANFVAGVWVPPKPEEPDNCCMSGCVNCVWDIFREELEEWATANAKAQKALRKLEGKHLKTSKKAINVTDQFLETTSTDDDAGRAMVDIDMWEGFEDIPIGIRAFMETEKEIKSRRIGDKHIVF